MRGAIRTNSYKLHRGITLHKLPVGSGFPALVFTIGSMAIFLIALPSLWFFVGLAVLLGFGVAGLLRFYHQRADTHSSGNLQK